MPGAPLLAAAFPEAQRLVAALRAAGRTVAAAESCTGGLLLAALTAFPGASDVVRGGVVAYADDLKAGLLGVPGDTLRRYGAVSPEVAAAMAQRARERGGADLGVGVTGVAGPGGQTPAKPAGLIYVALATAGRTEVQRLDGDLGREENRAAAVRLALDLGLRHAAG